MTERLKAKESTVQAGASAEEDVGAEGTAQQSKLVEVALDATRLGRSGGDGLEPGSTMRTLETVEAAEAATSARDVGQENVEETRNMGETPRDARREGEALPGLRTAREEPPQQSLQQRQEERPLELQLEAEQRELGQLEGPVGEAEQRTVVPPPDAQVEVPASGGQSRPKGRHRR
jgi:hypothetical protein